MSRGGPLEDSSGQSVGSADACPKGDNHQTIDVILKSRFHGAANIRGIRFQLLYSLREAFSLYLEGGPKSIRLEGVEDLDLLGWRCDNVYVQAKSSVNVWTLSRLNDVLKNFLDVNRAEPECRFRLALEGPVGSDIQRFMSRSRLPVKERIRAQKQVAGILEAYWRTTAGNRRFA